MEIDYGKRVPNPVMIRVTMLEVAFVLRGRGMGSCERHPSTLLCPRPYGQSLNAPYGGGIKR